jgi:sec-independent protein translocase protein TatC
MGKQPEEADPPASGGSPRRDDAQEELPLSAPADSAADAPAPARPAEPLPESSAATPETAAPAASTDAAATGDAPENHAADPEENPVHASSAGGETVPRSGSPDHLGHDEHGHHKDVHDPAYDDYSEYHHHDPYHDEHAPDHDYHQGHDQGAPADAQAPGGDYFHEPGVDEGTRQGGGGGGEADTFEGLFGGDDGEGGPVKTFLEHLEDLRWVLIKSIAAVLVAMFVCLIASPVLVALLKWPLEHPLVKPKDTRQFMQLQVGTNHWNVPVTTNDLVAWNIGTNRVTAYQLVPVPQGTNLVLTLRPAPPAMDSAIFGPVLKIYDPKEAVMLALKIALYGGLALALPCVGFFIGQFLVPALKRKEREYLYKGLIVGTGLFFVGVAFAYFIMLRFAYYFIIEFSKWLGFVSDEWRASEFIGFTLLLVLAMGLAFELPVALLTLVKIGILDYRKLNKLRPYWFILNLVASAFITPTGDPFTMLLMALPIQVLYEISVLIAWYWHRQDLKRDQAAAKEAAK